MENELYKGHMEHESYTWIFVLYMWPNYKALNILLTVNTSQSVTVMIHQLKLPPIQETEAYTSGPKKGRQNFKLTMHPEREISEYKFSVFG